MTAPLLTSLIRSCPLQNQPPPPSYEIQYTRVCIRLRLNWPDVTRLVIDEIIGSVAGAVAGVFETVSGSLVG
jgi:hypothetical protein